MLKWAISQKYQDTPMWTAASCGSVWDTVKLEPAAEVTPLLFPSGSHGRRSTMSDFLVPCQFGYMTDASFDLRLWSHKSTSCSKIKWKNHLWFPGTRELCFSIQFNSVICKSAVYNGFTQFILVETGRRFTIWKSFNYASVMHKLNRGFTLKYNITSNHNKI